jgi:hypothetical protein
MDKRPGAHPGDQRTLKSGDKTGCNFGDNATTLCRAQHDTPSPPARAPTASGFLTGAGGLQPRGEMHLGITPRAFASMIGNSDENGPKQIGATF